jgi:hypothetical protein
VIALGGGAVETPLIREALGKRAFTIAVDVDVDTAWERSRQTDRPLARDEGRFRALYARRAPTVRPGVRRRSVRRRRTPCSLLRVRGGIQARSRCSARSERPTHRSPSSPIHTSRDLRRAAQSRFGASRVGARVPAGRAAKTPRSSSGSVEELRLDRDGRSSRSAAAHDDVAASSPPTYLRGIAWIAVPTTLVGQVDAAIGGKTAIDLPRARTSSARSTGRRDGRRPGTLETLPEDERARAWPRSVKTGLLAASRSGSCRRRARPALRRVQGARLSARSARPRRAGDPEPRSHVRARTRGCRRLRGHHTWERRRARAARGTPPLGAADGRRRRRPCSAARAGRP